MKKIALVKCGNRMWEAFRIELNKRNIEPTILDIFKSRDLETLINNNWDGIIWTAKHSAKVKNLGKRVLDFYDQTENTFVYPDWKSYWHYDDKISQYFLFTQKQIPIPKTYLFYDEEEAINCLSNVDYPIVFKSTDGASSVNVQVIYSIGQAKKITKKIFRKNSKTLFKSKRQKGYLLFQEFQKNNPGDYRLVVYGKEIMGHFRPNRKDTPLASGSGIYIYQEIPHDLLTFGYNVYNKLGTNVMSLDIIKGNNGEWVIAEISVIYGDYGYDHYDNSKVYKLTDNGNWEEVVNPGGHYERVAGYVLDKWNLNE